MGDQTKKISFSFSKLAKKTAIVSTHLNKNNQDDDVSKVEFIDCLESRSIKLKDPVKLDQGPLIIPLTRTKEEESLNQQVNSENAESKGFNKPTNESRETGNEGTGNKTDAVNKNDGQNKHETLDEIAAREILEELNKKKAEDDEKRVFSVPLTSNAPSGEKESTLEDYDNIPVGEFGIAMLRGMGWAPGKGIGKNEKLVAPTLPTVRPKGMGLGADKVIKSVGKKSSNEELKMIKGSFIRVLAGSEKDAYGQVEGFDDESGRVIVKLALKNDSISLNEFMVQLIDANEFKKNSKVINVSKYEQYKEDEVKKESSEKKSQDEVHEKTSDEKLLSPHQSEKSDNKSKLKKKNRSSSCESEEKSMKDGRIKVSSDLPEARSARYKRSPSISSRSPIDRSRIKERSQSRGHKYRSTKHEASSKYHYKGSTSDDKKHRSYSTDSSGTSSSYRNTNKNQSNSSKTKSYVKDGSVSRRRSSSNSSTSDSSGNYSRKKKNKHTKKKSSSNKYRSRSRSRSPRKHKHKKSKKCS